MITVKTAAEIELMRKANLIVRDTLNKVGDAVKAGVTTSHLNKIAHDYIISQGAIPSFLGYEGYPASACISVNEQVVHGIPSDRRIEDGDIVSVDIGAIFKGYHGDAARTFEVGQVGELKHKLVEVTKQSFFEGIKVLRDGVRLGDLGHAIQSYAESNGFSVVRALVGHGIGTEMHEDPQVPNYGEQGRGMRLRAGMTIAIEPMINAGDYAVRQLSDGWTVVTVDGKPSAHYENTVVITSDGCDILSL
ncbi:MAG: type I methionyl aminopeptidase [Clostridia bacterium]|nr:type I methionyl aminopeptidase [Clostridia bacterium]